MRHRFTRLIAAALAGVVGCGDGGSGPSAGGDDGARLAARFEALADSVDGEGWSPTAQALRHAAEIVRLTGHATPVTLSIDGGHRSFLAVAEQLDFPQIQCWWPADSTGLPPGDTVVVDPDGGPAPPPPHPVTECTEVGTHSMRTLIAWEPDRMAEVVRLVADAGSNEVNPSMHDVMTGLPVSATPDSAPGSPPNPGPIDTVGGGSGFPGFLGEYLVGDEGMWFAVEGSQSNALEQSGGACTADLASFDWAEFRCEAARFAYEFRMRVEPVRMVPLDGGDSGAGPDGEHAIAMERSRVDGVRLTVVDWTPPPEPVPPPPGPLPPDSVVPSR